MTDTEWMEAEAYEIADRLNEMLNKAYKHGASDTWEIVKTLWNTGTCSFEWSVDELMGHYEKESRYHSEVKKIADAIGIHALYAMVKDMRGE